MTYPTLPPVDIPQKRVVFADKLKAAYVNLDTPTTSTNFEFEYPWSEWSEWVAGPWENIGDVEAVGRRHVATRVTLFKVLEYEEVITYRVQQQRQLVRYRRNAAWQVEVERRFETQWTTT